MHCVRPAFSFFPDLLCIFLFSHFTHILSSEWILFLCDGFVRHIIWCTLDSVDSSRKKIFGMWLSGCSPFFSCLLPLYYISDYLYFLHFIRSSAIHFYPFMPLSANDQLHSFIPFYLRISLDPSTPDCALDPYLDWTHYLSGLIYSDLPLC